ncbi:MAG TPA: hypothetical protein VF278_07945 [Pirellulales bacterium]
MNRSAPDPISKMIFLRILVASSIGAHALLGCCWHHAHACPEEAASLSHGSPPAVHLACVGAAEDDCDHQHGCSDARCVVIRGKPPSRWLLTAAAEWACISTAPPCVAIAVHREGFSLDFGEAAASPRIYLLHQVLLI